MLALQLANLTNVAYESINNIRTVKMLCIDDILLRYVCAHQFTQPH